MSEQPEVPVTAGFAAFDPTPHREAIAKGIAEIEEAGVKVLSVYFKTAGAPPQFNIRFSADTPQWTARMKLEAKQYDVGSNLGVAEIGFYAVKRTEKTKGWAT